MKTLIVDNYDSFTYNLYQLVGVTTGELPLVVRNDELTWAEFLKLDVDNVILSPGPGRPDNARDFGICRQIILEAKMPVLGVCLGHQGIAEAFGGSVVPAPEPMHGRTSGIRHCGTGIFQGIPQRFTAVRYHSLMVGKPVPPCLRVTAWTADEVIMGLAHVDRPLYGVQFHPESINTEYGAQLLKNFLGPSTTRSYSLPVKAVRREQNDWHVLSRKLDLDRSPEDVFRSQFGSLTPAFWLDSSDEDAGRSRFSFMGTGTVVAAGARVLDSIEAELRERRCEAPDLPFDFNGGLVGYLGYELKSECGAKTAHQSPYPDACQMFVDRFLAFDHRERKIYVVFAGPQSNAASGQAWLDEMEARLRHGVSPAPPPRLADNRVRFTLEQDHDQYIAHIADCQRWIREGESYEICLTNRLRATTAVDPLDYYCVLRRLNPAPYSAFLRFPGVSVACSSPELFLRVDRQRFVESRPIKGTLRRSPDPAQDSRLRDALRMSVKNRSENLMIVDLLRNDLGRVCEIGSVHVPQMMEVETYTNLHQLVSTVRGKLREDASVVDCLRSTFPGGSMTGAPKLRTMELIDSLEESARGIYSGTIGFLALNGSANLNIVIRTAVFAGGMVSIGVGGAIVALSDPEDEFEEALLKAKALIEGFKPTPSLKSRVRQHRRDVSLR